MFSKRLGEKRDIEKIARCRLLKAVARFATLLVIFGYTRGETEVHESRNCIKVCEYTEIFARICVAKGLSLGICFNWSYKLAFHETLSNVPWKAALYICWDEKLAYDYI